jgi:hypothetical protein
VCVCVCACVRACVCVWGSREKAGREEGGGLVVRGEGERERERAVGRGTIGELGAGT